MKKVLIITLLYPPTNAIGAVRLAKFAKYMPLFGWEPLVLTVGLGLAGEGLKDELGVGRVYRVGKNQKTAKKNEQQYNYKTQSALKVILSSAAKMYRDLRYYPEREAGFSNQFIQKAKEIILHEKVDIVFSSSFPITAHLVAAEIKREFNIPWVADFRDLWTINNLNAKTFPLLYFEQRLERKTMLLADALVTVSKTLGELLEGFHGKRVYIVPNGYDEDDFLSLSFVAPSTSKFIITYTGTTHRMLRNPKLLFEALAIMMKEGIISPNSISIRFIGSDSEMVRSLAKQYGVEVEALGNLSHEETLYRQKQSHVLLLLNYERPLEKGVLTGKVFEYMGAKKPILGIGYKDDMLMNLFSETKAGVMCDTFSEVMQALKKYISEFKNKGEIAFQGDNEKIKNYTRKNLTMKLCQIFEGTLACK